MPLELPRDCDLFLPDDGVTTNQLPFVREEDLTALTDSMADFQEAWNAEDMDKVQKALEVATTMTQRYTHLDTLTLDPYDHNSYLSTSIPQCHEDLSAEKRLLRIYPWSGLRRGTRDQRIIEKLKSSRSLLAKYTKYAVARASLETSKELFLDSLHGYDSDGINKSLHEACVILGPYARISSVARHWYDDMTRLMDLTPAVALLSNNDASKVRYEYYGSYRYRMGKAMMKGLESGKTWDQFDTSSPDGRAFWREQRRVWPVEEREAYDLGFLSLQEKLG